MANPVVYLSPILNGGQIFLANGQLNINGTVNTFLAGTTTAANTYTSNTGGTANPNPLTINTEGFLTNPCWIPAGQATKFVINDNLGNQLDVVDDVSGVNDPTSFSGTASQAYNQANAAFNQANTAYTVALQAYGAANTAGAAATSAVATATAANGVAAAANTTATAALAAAANNASTAQLVLTSNGSANVANTTGVKWITQWGSTTTTSSAGTITVPFNFAFPNACFNVQVSVAAPSGVGANWESYLNGAPSAGFFTWRTSSGSNIAITLYYVAIGW